jgi:hypothetical protein
MEFFPRHSAIQATKPQNRLYLDLMRPLNASLERPHYVQVFTDESMIIQKRAGPYPQE